MKMTLEDYQSQEYDYPSYCSKCDDITGFGLEPDAWPNNCPDAECEECERVGTLYGMEAAMICGLIEIEEDEAVNNGDQSVMDVNQEAYDRGEIEE